MTRRQGTSFAAGRVVRGTCEVCEALDVLLYSVEGDERLRCPNCTRVWAKANPRAQACDNCGATGNVWRDPIHRRNEYLCINCHDPESLFQNRWANKVRESKPLDPSARPVCAASGYGTECRGEVKWRSAYEKSLCNKHAGRTGVGPNG